MLIPIQGHTTPKPQSKQNKTNRLHLFPFCSSIGCNVSTLGYYFQLLRFVSLFALIVLVCLDFYFKMISSIGFSFLLYTLLMS
jgi:hypothetical protein